MLLNALKAPAEEYITENQAFPPNVESIGGQTSGKYTANIVSNPQRLYFQATLSGENSQIDGKTIKLTLDPKSRSWTCSTGSPNGLDNRYLHRACRSQ
jgi:hypothetical protein